MTEACRAYGMNEQPDNCAQNKACRQAVLACCSDAVITPGPPCPGQVHSALPCPVVSHGPSPSPEYRSGQQLGSMGYEMGHLAPRPFRGVSQMMGWRGRKASHRES